MSLTWEESFNVRIYDTDFNNKIKISSIFNYMQEAATNHADNLNLGCEELLDKELFWALSRVKIDVLDFPKFGDEIKIETWPKGTEKLFALRDFKIYNSQNQIIAKATSAWLIIDSEKLRPRRPKLFTENIGDFKNDHALSEVLGKISECEKKEFIFEKRVGYSDIDINQHMNNVKYVELITDSFSQATFKEHQIKSMQVNFLSECKFGNEIQVFKGELENNSNCYYVEGINQHKNNKVFNATVKWG